MPDYGIQIEGGWYDNRIDPVTGKERHCYRDPAGTVVLSSTKVFEVLGISDFSMVNQENLEWKRGFGDAVHAGVEYLVADDLDWDSLDEEVIPAVTGIEQFLKKVEYKWEACEERRIHSFNGMKCGMTLDHRGTLMHQGVRRHAVLDLKTGSKHEKYWEWQLGSYICPQPKVDLGWLGIILQVDKDGNVKPHYLKDVVAAQREFQILLAAAMLKLNNGYAKHGG